MLTQKWTQVYGSVRIRIHLGSFLTDCGCHRLSINVKGQQHCHRSAFRNSVIIRSHCKMSRRRCTYVGFQYQWTRLLSLGGQSRWPIIGPDGPRWSAMDSYVQKWRASRRQRRESAMMFSSQATCQPAFYVSRIFKFLFDDVTHNELLCAVNQVKNKCGSPSKPQYMMQCWWTHFHWYAAYKRNLISYAFSGS